MKTKDELIAQMQVQVSHDSTAMFLNVIAIRQLSTIFFGFLSLSLVVKEL